MFRWQCWVGVVIGLLTGFAILSRLAPPRSQPTPTGAILSECDGRMCELVIHYEPAAKGIVATVYREFLGVLDREVTVYVVCPDRAAYAELLALAGPVQCRFSPIITGHPITTWSRDRWVALTPASPTDATTLWSPAGETAAEIWPARAGDEQVGQDIARVLAPAVRARRSDLYFDGGDFLADGENVFVVPRVLQRNLQHTVGNRAQFLNLVGNMFQRHVILLDQAPDHHAGMFMASVGGRTMLVGDPRQGRALLPAGCETNTNAADAILPCGPDFTAASQHLFDAVAKQCAAAGYRVIRIPVVPGLDGRTYLTYVNVLQDRDGNRKIVYLPYYQGVGALNMAAREVWSGLGFEIRPVDCTATYRHYGCLHCLVNVLKRV